MRHVAPAVIVVILMSLAPVPSSHGEGEPSPDDSVVIAPKEGGWSIEELFRLVGRETGESIVFDPEHPGIANRRIELVGEQRVPREHLFRWFQSLLSFQRIVLVPVLGGDWVALGMQSPLVGYRPIFVPEEDLGDWQDRRGVFLVSTVILDRPRDAALVAELLTPLMSPEVGRLIRVSTGSALVIADFAPRAFALARLARRLTAESTRRNQRYEELMAAARTEAAAEWFRSRLESE